MSAVADVLRAAADRLERTGKCEGSFYDHAQRDSGIDVAQCRACAEGAVAVEAVTLAKHSAAMKSLRDYLEVETAKSVHMWSDSHSLDEVVAGLRAAADAAS